MDFLDFFAKIDTTMAIFALLLALSVVFLNGFTDAPNAISSAVGTGVLKMWQGCAICAIFNFLGVFVTLKINSSVAKNVFSLANFGKNYYIGICATFLSVVIFTIFTWLLAMPSSESHALISAIFGASLAISGKIGNLKGFLSIIFYVIISCVFSFFASNVIFLIFKNKNLPYGKLQVVSTSLTSFMHGAQDGQKFVGILMCLFVAKNQISDVSCPLSLILLVSLVISLGALMGGGRIIKTFAENTVKLNIKSGFIADMGSFVSCLFFSLIGAPVSTSNIKACSLMGTGHAEGEKINKKTAKSLFLTTFLTFPICFVLGYIFSKIFLIL